MKIINYTIIRTFRQSTYNRLKRFGEIRPERIRVAFKKLAPVLCFNYKIIGISLFCGCHHFKAFVVVKPQHFYSFVVNFKKNAICTRSPHPKNKMFLVNFVTAEKFICLKLGSAMKIFQLITCCLGYIHTLYIIPHYNKHFNILFKKICRNFIIFPIN